MNELPPTLPSEVLDRRSQLPRKPDPVVLRGPRVLVRPYERDDVDALHACTSGPNAEELVWRFMPAGPFDSADDLRAHIERLDSTENARTFTVLDADEGTPIGSFTLMNNEPAHLKVEIGAVWYGIDHQGRGINAEVTALVADHVFALGYLRFEWKCNALNERSRAAALRVGFRFEGIHESHMIAKDRVRDTAWYRMLASERVS